MWNFECLCWEVHKYRRLEAQIRSACVNFMAKSRDVEEKECLIGLWKDIGTVHWLAQKRHNFRH
jgi:hypothetical protein